METTNPYKSFNTDKSIEELQYEMLQYKIRLEDLSYTLHFLKKIVESDVYQPQVINLFETLANFKKDIEAINKKRVLLLKEVDEYKSHIKIKIECDDLACDNFFINEHDELEQKLHLFFVNVSNLKIKAFQYLESVIKK